MFQRKLRWLTSLEVILILSLPLTIAKSSRSQMLPKLHKERMTLTNNSLGGYEASPKAKKTSQRRSVAGGTRSPVCQNLIANGDLTLVVPPEKVVHLTATNNPSFFFYSKVSTKVPVVYTLIDPEVAEPLVEKTLAIEKPGYYKIETPPSVKLEPQKTYLWHIAIPCSNNPDVYQEVLKAAVEYVPLSLSISTKLERANSPLEKSRIYATEGFWYDALYFANYVRPQIPQYWQQLLADISFLKEVKNFYHQ